MLIKSNPELFVDMHTVRVGHILQLIIVKQQRESNCLTLAAAFYEILSLPPYQLLYKVKSTLEDYSHTEVQLDQSEILHFEGNYRELSRARFTQNFDPSDRKEDEIWYQWREQKGCVGRENSAFYTNVWDLLHCCKGLHIGEKLNSKNRLDSEITLSQMTIGEQSFKLHINHLLNKIQSPVYRQLTVEALRAIAVIIHDSSVHIDDTLITDVIIAHAARINWLSAHPANIGNYEEHEPQAWQAFYELPPHKVANAILDALIHLLNQTTRQPTTETTL
jgi:phosphorylase kinase alpha/beta subunit